MKQRYRMALEAIYSIVDLENYPKVELIKDIIEKALCFFSGRSGGRKR